MSEETFPIEGGILPESKLSVRRRNLRAVTLWKGGIAPVKKFTWRSTILSLDFLSNKVEGISPERLLRDSMSLVSEEQLDNERGIPPVRVLFARLTWLRELLLPNESGMLPSRLLPTIFSVWRFGSLPSSSGIVPDRRLPPRFIKDREVRSARHPDICPESCAEARFRETTRGGNFVPQVTPFQLQKLSELLLHESRMPMGSLIPDLKQRRAWRSISDLFAGAAASIAVVKEKRMSKEKNRHKKIEDMMSRVYRMWWKNQEGKNCMNLSALG